MSGRALLNGRYVLDDLPVPGGGMGQVWFGRDTILDREIAVKFTRIGGNAADEELLRRFRRESRIAARLQHPGVPAVYDWGYDNGQPFMVMQRVRGVTIADLIAEYGAPLPVGWSATIAAQVCSVLYAAHRAGLIHRDLKPRNLMLEPDGSVKVLDFGLSAAPTLPDFSTITRPGDAPGTPAYMAPEQFQANDCSPAGDLYSLGCTLHEMLSGEAPFSGTTSYAVSQKHVNEPPLALRQLRPEVPELLERLVLDLLAKTPADRPADAYAVFERLLPFVCDVGALRGAVAAPTRPGPVQMYAVALSRAIADHTLVVRPAERPLSSNPVVDLLPPPDGQDLLGQADRLFDNSHYRRAAEAYGALADADPAREDLDLMIRCRRREATCYTKIGDNAAALRTLDLVLHDLEQIVEADDPRIVGLKRDLAMLQLDSGRRSGVTALMKSTKPR